MRRLGLCASLALLIAAVSLAVGQPFVVPPGPVVVTNSGGTTSVQITATAGGSLQVECAAGCGGGAVTANQGTPNTTANRWPVQITDGVDLALVTAAGAVVVDGSGVTQPISGTIAATQSGAWTVTANAGTGTFQVSVPVALTSVVTGQQAVTAAAVVLPTNTGRIVCLRVKDGGTQTVYYGPAGVTTATGQELIPGEGVCRPVDNSDRFFVIAAGAGSTIGFDVYN